MKNKKVIRRPNETGGFTTIQHTILFDKRLSSNDKIVLVTILSDAESFRLSQKLLINRLGLDKKTIQTIFKNLETCGYIRRKKMPRGFYYTISEYGNLIPDESNTEVETEREEVKTESETPVQPPLILSNYTDLLTPLLGELEDSVMTSVIQHLNNAIESGKLNDPRQMTEANITKIIDKYKPKVSPSDSKAALDKIKQFVEERSNGEQMTIAKKKTLVAKVMTWVSEQDLSQLTEQRLKDKISVMKSGFISHGHLDQRFQN